MSQSRLVMVVVLEWARSEYWLSGPAEVKRLSRQQPHHVKEYDLYIATGAGLVLAETLRLDIDFLVVAWLGSMRLWM
jgi:hypothetical protein